MASAGEISGFEHNCISSRGRRDDLHRRDERLWSIGVHEQIDLGGSNVGYENQRAIKKVTEALHRAIKGGRPPRLIVFDSITDLSQALLRAKDAHSEFERGLDAKDYNWPLWYAAYIAREQGLAEKSASKLASSEVELSPGSENAPPHRVISFLHLRPVVLSVSYLDGNPFDHGRDGSETSRQS